MPQMGSVLESGAFWILDFCIMNADPIWGEKKEAQQTTKYITPFGEKRDKSRLVTFNQVPSVKVTGALYKEWDKAVPI